MIDTTLAGAKPGTEIGGRRSSSVSCIIHALLTRRERWRGLILIGVAILMALVETLGVASIMPFLAVLGNPSVVESNTFLAWFYRRGGFVSTDAYLYILGLAALVAVVVAALFRAAAQYTIFRFANMRRYSLSKRLFDGYLGQPYAFFLHRNSADLVKRTLSDVDIVVDQFLMPGVQLIAYSIVAVTLLTLLIVVDPAVAACVLLVVCGLYAAIYLLSRRLLARLGHDRNLANRQRFSEASEAFDGIKEIKLLGKEATFAGRFTVPAFRFASHKATNDTLALVPRYLIEAVAIGGALAVALVLMRTRQDLGAVLPILGLYAIAGYRLLPAVQQIYSGLTRLRFGLPVAESVVEDLHVHQAEGLKTEEVRTLQLHQSIRLEAVTFRYHGALRPAVDAVDLEISAKTTVGVIGATGAGKTTIIDLILGLLEPTAGRILIDGEPLSSSNRGAWQRSIGYVPQTIFLADASVAENIAFGVPREKIDWAAVERAARIANIHDFVANELPKGYDADIGERGVRLSGGQRQRIGIARALYRDPSMLVFDEATSALDDVTEAAVLEAVSKLQHKKTIILIAHRLTTIDRCDRRYELLRGKVKKITEENAQAFE